MDIHITTSPPTTRERDMMAERVYALIFPNVPRTASELDAFNRAVKYQIEHEKSVAATGATDMPQGATSFTIGEFSMSFNEDAMSNTLTKKTTCPYAYSLLLRAGLLYKGVER